ncbi:hypothetical protein JCM10908_005630 [Rhodotorula pacifica]|uniref:uncharacterized protein n=1 Tax=Rhodotorula pacifica TaxID=1495444 RepID=UPI00316D63CD
MSLSDLDYVNATLAKSEQSPPKTNGASTLEPSTAATQPAGAGAGAGAPTSSSSRPPVSSGADQSPPGGVPSLAALLANLQSVTNDAQRLGLPSSEVATSSTTGAAGAKAEQDEEEGDDDAELDLDSLKALLTKLDETEGAADDLEGRLDGLIDNLDKLLGVMGGAGAAAAAGERSLEDGERAEK